MSNGNNGSTLPAPSGVEKRMTITLKAEGYADEVKEWMVPEELIRPYTLAFDVGISVLGAKISKAIYDKLIADNIPGVENYIGKTMIEAGES